VIYTPNPPYIFMAVHPTKYTDSITFTSTQTHHTVCTKTEHKITE